MPCKQHRGDLKLNLQWQRSSQSPTWQTANELPGPGRPLILFNVLLASGSFLLCDGQACLHQRFSRALNQERCNLYLWDAKNLHGCLIRGRPFTHPLLYLAAFPVFLKLPAAVMWFIPPSPPAMDKKSANDTQERIMSSIAQIWTVMVYSLVLVLTSMPSFHRKAVIWSQSLFSLAAVGGNVPSCKILTCREKARDCFQTMFLDESEYDQ